VSKHLRVGIVGFGGAGQAHRHYFSCIQGCEVTKVFDPKDEGRRRAKASGDVEVFDDLAKFWPDLDVVSVCSPDGTHAGYIVEALERSLSVLCEKPLTNSLEGVRQILVAEQRARGVLAVLHQMRFVPLHVAIRNLATTGAFGTVHLLEGYYIHDLRERAFVYDDWRAAEVATPLVYAGCHFVDLLRWFSGEEITQIHAMGGNIAFPRYPQADTVIASLRFQSGALGNVVIAFASAGPQDHSVRVYGTERTVENNLVFARSGKLERMLVRPKVLHQSVFRSDRVEPRRILDQTSRYLPALVAHGLFGVVRKLSSESNGAYGANHYPLRLYEHGIACVRAVEDFVRAVRSESRPLCTGAEAARTVIACLAGNESQQSGRTIDVPALEEVCADFRR
jgi:predicted dehydrogenase